MLERNFHTLLVRVENNTNTLENCVPVSYKFKCTLSVLPSHSTLRSLFNRTENMHPQRFLHKNDHSIFIHNSQTLEAAQISINRRTGKRTMVEYHSATNHKVYTVWFHFYEILEYAKLLTYSDRSHINGCFWGGHGSCLGRGMRKHSGVLEIFCVWIGCGYTSICIFKNKWYT